MPLMNGIEATKIISKKIKDNELPYTPVAALSAGQLRSDDEHYYFDEVGFATYVPKPTGRDEFYKLLSKYKIIC